MKHPDIHTRELAGLAATNMLSSESKNQVIEYFSARMKYRAEYEAGATMTALLDEVSCLAQSHPIQTIAFLEREHLSDKILSSGSDGAVLELRPSRFKSWGSAIPTNSLNRG